MRKGGSMLFSAGDTSGDRYGKELALAIRSLLRGQVEFFGVGGRGMAGVGIEIISDFTSRSVVASLGFLRHLHYFYSTYRKLIQMVKRKHPQVAILIDSPTFNLFLAPRLKRLGVRVVYFISPQVWAWGKGRIRRIRRSVDKMIVIFPFEEDIYRAAKVPVEYFGHPLTRRVQSKLERGAFCRKYGLNPVLPIISLLPGSRLEEVDQILPILIESAYLLGESYQYVLSAAPNIGCDQLRRVIESLATKHDRKLGITILGEDLYDALQHSEAAAVCSGTATLETALVGTPFVMVYRIPGWRWSLRKIFVSVPHYCIVNLIAGRRVVAELMQDQFTPERTAEEIKKLLNEEGERTKMGEEFAEIRALLDRTDAVCNAARSIIGLSGAQ